MELTDEQKKIIENVKKYNNIKINAFAGTGKTTTLYEITKNLENKKFLYLAFNKSIVDEAKSKFNSNVDVKTVHGLAYGYAMRKLNLSNPKIKSNYKITDICKIIKNDNFSYGEIVYKFFNSFCDSSCNTFDNKSINIIIKNNFELKSSIKIFFQENIGTKLQNPNLQEIKSFKKELSLNIINDVNLLFNKMLHGEIDITHSFYFKFFQININEFKNFINYDYVLLDEAQDSNEATLDIFNKLKGKKIMVGDPHQNIYGFRGSINIMNNFECDIVNYLSISFRFHDKISYLANNLIKGIKGEIKDLKTLKSGVCHNSNEFILKDIIHNNEGKIIIDEKSIIDTCIITRTNGKLISFFDEYLKKEIIPIFIRNPEDIFSLPLSVFYLNKFFTSKLFYFQDKIKEKWLLKFNNITELSNYAEDVNDINLKSAIELLNTNLDIEFLYNKAKEIFFDKNLQKNNNKIYLTNAHTSKGLEWDQVIVKNDFVPFDFLFARNFIGSVQELNLKINEKDKTIQPLIEELNLFYVAITRAKKRLIIESENLIYINNGEKGINILDLNITKQLEKIGQNIEINKQIFEKRFDGKLIKLQ